jgi:hypothetical protein
MGLYRSNTTRDGIFSTIVEEGVVVAFVAFAF